MLIDEIARVCHAANRELQAIHNDPAVPVSPAWDDDTQETRDSVCSGVEHVLAGADPEQSHRNWVRDKLAAGWTWGEVKDPERKTHPNLVPYAELPPEQRVKDELFGAIVRALAPKARPDWYGRRHSVRVFGPLARRKIVLDDEFELRGVTSVSVDETHAESVQRVTVELLSPCAEIERPEAAA